MNNNKLWKLILLCLCLAYAGPSTAQASAKGKSFSCKKYAVMPEVKIKKGSTDIKNVYSKSKKHLTAQEKSFSVKGFSETLGLTTLDYQVHLEFSIQTITNQAIQQECHWFDAITINITAKQTVYVASEHAKDLCEKNEILHHEMKHVTVNRKFINDMNAKLKREVQLHVKENYLKQSQPIKKREALQNYMSKQLTASINKLKDKYVEKNLKEQALIDTPEEYKKVSESCS